MNVLGLGLSDANHDEDALPVQEAELAMKRRLGRDEDDILAAQSNLAITYQRLGRVEAALSLRRDVYFGTLKLRGAEDRSTLKEVNNYANSLGVLERFEEARSLLRQTIPVARRVFGENDQCTLTMRINYARALFLDDVATLGDIREAMSTLEEMERTARRVFGSSHPMTGAIGRQLQKARAVLRLRETPPQNAVDASS